MKKLRLITLAFAAFALVGMVACNSAGKTESKEVVKEEVVDEAVSADTTMVEEVVADSTAVEDTVAVEETVAE